MAAIPPEILGHTEIVCMKPQVLDKIMNSVGARPPESGGILLATTDLAEITEFYFDETADCSAITYTPDIRTLQKKLDEEWAPRNLDFVGFVHSHPGMDCLSAGDLDYIARFFECNSELTRFIAPIVVPEEFRINFFIVERTAPRRPVPAWPYLTV